MRSCIRFKLLAIFVFLLVTVPVLQMDAQELYYSNSMVQGGSTVGLLNLFERSNKQQFNKVDNFDDIECLKKILLSAKRRKHWQQKIAEIKVLFIYVDSMHVYHYMIALEDRIIDLRFRVEYILIDKSDIGLYSDFISRFMCVR